MTIAVPGIKNSYYRTVRFQLERRAYIHAALLSINLTILVLHPTPQPIYWATLHVPLRALLTYRTANRWMSTPA